MSKKRTQYSSEFKAQVALAAIQGGETIPHLLKGQVINRPNQVWAALIVPILLLAGCASYSIYGGDPAQRQLRNQWSANYELCERLTVATLAPEKIREEWTNEINSRSVDCNLYAATTHTAVNRDMPVLRWSTQWTAPKMSQTIPAPSQLIHAR